ncbi:MAG: M14 family zinc carboxypeptidase [Bacteroidales bacterium]
MRRLLLIAVIIVSVCSNAAGQQPGDSIRLREYIVAYGQAEVTVKYEGSDKASELGRIVSIDRYREGSLHLIISNATADAFLESGIPYKLIEPEEAKGVITAPDLMKALEWQSYPTYTQYDSVMRKFAADYPAICRLDTIGTSIYGKLVMVLKISDNVHLDEADEPEVFYSSNIHGDELAGFVLMLRLADYLLTNYATDSYARYLVDNLQIYINPLANPDGTYRTGDAVSDNPTRGNANGRDLNRNFPDPMQPGVVQEKENIDMIAFMRQRRFVLSANFHSGAEVVNYPWDRWSRMHADNDWFVTLSRAYADTVHSYAPAGYLTDYSNGIVRGSVWYVIYGGRQDFVTWELQGREVTIEIHDIKRTPADQLESLWQYNYRSLLNYLAFAIHGVRGRVTNAGNGEPLEARISVQEHDTDSSQVYSSPATGHYQRLLSAGTWQLRFSSPGFRDTLVTELQVSGGATTWLDIALEPLLNDEDTLRPDNMLLIPNPSKGIFKMVLPEGYEGEVVVDIISSSGKHISTATIQYNTGAPVSFNRPDLSPGVYIIRAKHMTSGAYLQSRAIIIR